MGFSGPLGRGGSPLGERDAARNRNMDGSAWMDPLFSPNTTTFLRLSSHSNVMKIIWFCMPAVCMWFYVVDTNSLFNTSLQKAMYHRNVMSCILQRELVMEFQRT